jgi:predicted SprT family Zn-dependent metalloprotease
LPLLRDQSEHEIMGTLAHEMIHQWQFDVLKRRPNHGPDFRRMMRTMNRDGLDITISHALDNAVRSLAKFAWRCRECGRDYHRQRRTIRPSRHRCGACRGRLKEVSPMEHIRRTSNLERIQSSPISLSPGQGLQMELPFAIP